MIYKFLAAALLLTLRLEAQNHVHFEGRQTHPIAITPDGTKLLALNTPDGRLCIYTLGNPASPGLYVEIPTGSEPVSIRIRSNTEAWIVNEASDSISIVSLLENRVTATLTVTDEPADVVFAAGKAFVSCAQNRLIRVFDATSHQSLGSIPLQGQFPRALAASPDGSKVFVAFLYSGNNTTILPASVAPPQPAPTNAALPSAPSTALIIPASDSRISRTVLDNDIAEINAATLTVTRYLGGVGTHLFDIAVHSGTGDLWVPNSESHNLIRFEPELKGKFSSHRLTRIPTSGNLTIFDLNPGIDHTSPPSPATRDLALAQPTSVTLSPSENSAWLTAFNSDRIAEISIATGEVLRRIDLRRIDLRPATETSRQMRGPRATAIHPSGNYLYSLNKLSNTLSSISLGSGEILVESPIGTTDPLPLAAKQGRGFFYDARLSAHGTVSCATCHLDADRDGLAWDLGDPDGEMLTLKGSALSAHITSVVNRTLHPMKGPMVTQTLRGMASNVAVPAALVTPASAEVITTKFHWRGDKPSIQSFNSTFPNLLGGTAIPSADMDNLAAYLLGIIHPPNPNRNLDRSLQVSVSGGDPRRGNVLFQDHLSSHCSSCHTMPGGTDQNLDLRTEVGGRQEMKNPPLRTTYQRADLFDITPGSTSISGYGLLSDGTGKGLPISHPYVLSELSSPADFADVTAFIKSFDTGTAPVATASLTVTSTTATTSGTTLDTLENARIADGDLVAFFASPSGNDSFLFDKITKTYLQKSASLPALTRSQLLARLTPGSSITFAGTPPGQGARFGIDRNENGTRDADEFMPTPVVSSHTSGKISIQWPLTTPGCFVESSEGMTNASPWIPLPAARTASGDFWRIEIFPAAPKAFFRLRKTF